MENLTDKSAGILAMSGLIFVLIYTVFISDICRHNTGREERIKKNSLVLSKAGRLLNGVLQPLQKPAKDVIQGRDSWRFYRKYVNSLKRNRVQNRAVEEIAFVKESLNRRGIQLIIVPVPVKAQIHSDKLVGEQVDTLKLYRKYIQLFKENGIFAVDLSEILKSEGSYLKQDTHWSSESVETVAKMCAGLIDQKSLSEVVNVFTRQSYPIQNSGDLSDGLQEEVNLNRVVDEDGKGVSPSKESEILLLGDSFANIYSKKEMGWGTNAGLAEQLTFVLGRRVDTIVVNNGGESGSRQLLEGELLSGYDRLKNKKVVIWEFVYSEFTDSDWSRIQFPVKVKSDFMKIDRPVNLTGTVLGFSPKNSDSIYKDQLMTVRMRAGEKQVLFRAFIKKNNVITNMNSLSIGDQIQVSLYPAAENTKNTARSEVEDLELQLADHAFGELKQSGGRMFNWQLYLFIFLSSVCSYKVLRKTI